MAVVIVSGAMANKPYQGGEAWVRLSWALGFKQLGFDVYFVEQIDPGKSIDAAGQPCALESSVNKRYFDEVTKQFGLAAGLIDEHSQLSTGLSIEELVEIAKSAVLLVNIGGHLTLPRLLDAIRRKAYIDIDPGFTQFWHVDSNNRFHIAQHDWYFTIGENIGQPDCSIPTGDIAWLPIRQPVVLAHWPVVGGWSNRRFTSIANWRGPFGPVEYGGQTFGLKVHEFRKFIELPKRSGESFEMALNIHPDDHRDLNALKENGWRIVDPQQAAATPDTFRTYVQQSAAEFSAAQGIYVDTNSGWFSDRTARYLTSGKPALVQDTGFGRNLPVGDGLLSFRTVEDALAGVEAITAEYDRHARAARKIAEEFFDSNIVLQSMIERIGLDADASRGVARGRPQTLVIGDN